MKDLNQELGKLKRNPQNVRFEHLCRVAMAFGFTLKGRSGSHRVYTRPGVKELLNFQNCKGKAKAYQVQQFIKMIERYDLLTEAESDV